MGCLRGCGYFSKVGGISYDLVNVKVVFFHKKSIWRTWGRWVISGCFRVALSKIKAYGIACNLLVYRCGDANTNFTNERDKLVYLNCGF